MRKQRMMIRTLSNSNYRTLECEVGAIVMTVYRRLWTSGFMGFMVHFIAFSCVQVQHLPTTNYFIDV